MLNLLTIQDVEKIFKIPKSTQAKLRMNKNEDSIPFIKMGKTIYYDSIEVEAWIRSHNKMGVPSKQRQEEHMKKLQEEYLKNKRSTS